MNVNISHLRQEIRSIGNQKCCHSIRRCLDTIQNILDVSDRFKINEELFTAVFGCHYSLSFKIHKNLSSLETDVDFVERMQVGMFLDTIPDPS
jgi:hypothetical protein